MHDPTTRRILAQRADDHRRDAEMQRRNGERDGTGDTEAQRRNGKRDGTGDTEAQRRNGKRERFEGGVLLHA